MSDVLVDATVLIDIATDDPVWSGWSAVSLQRAGQGGRLVINPLIYAALSMTHSRIELLDALLPEDVFLREPLPWDAAFLAGKVLAIGGRAGGMPGMTLPDALIGAHALLRGYCLLTREPERYRHGFPRLRIIAPPADRIPG